MPRRPFLDPPLVEKRPAPAKPMDPKPSTPRCAACFGVGWLTYTGSTCRDCRGSGAPREARA